MHTVGKQLSEVLILHRNMSKQDARVRAVEMLKLTGIPNPENCMRQSVQGRLYRRMQSALEV